MSSDKPIHGAHVVGEVVLSPPFLICAIVLLVAALGLRPGMANLAARYRKETVALRQPLAEFHSGKLASFRKVPDSVRPKVDLTDAGTKEILFVGLEEKNTLVKSPVVFLTVTYYSNPEDKVPHTPDVCYRQIGNTVERMTTLAVDIPALAPQYPKVEMRFLELKQSQGKAILAYVFYANGEFVWDREQVRWIINRPGERYTFFSKIEMITAVRRHGDAVDALDRCKKLIREVLPVLVKDHYPDVKSLK